MMKRRRDQNISVGLPLPDASRKSGAGDLDLAIQTETIHAIRETLRD